MSKPTNPSPALIATVSGAALVVVLVLIFSLAQSKQKEIDPTPTPTVATRVDVSPSPSPEVSPEVSPSPTSSTSPTPSPSPTEGTVNLPESAKSFLANFYSSYKNKDRDRLSTLFTPDTTAELASLHSTLFTGYDTNGNPGGPTLFETNSAAEWVTEYTLLGSAPQGANWTVTVREKRASASSEFTGTVTTLITLAPAKSGAGTWLIDSYVHAGSTDKYNGFFIQ